MNHPVMQANYPDSRIETMNLPVAEIKTLLHGFATDLCNSMESGDCEKALAAQSRFAETIAKLWNGLGESEVNRKIKSILRSIAGWSIPERPEQILDPVNDEKIKRELKLFQGSLVLIDS